MPILYSVVARGITVLAKYASCPGNFSEVTEQIISKIPPEDSKLTYSHGSFLFHYICEDRIIYMCITDDEFERSRAFLYLGEIKRRFQAAYGSRAQTSLAYAMNTEFSPILANEMKHYSESRDVDTISRVHGELDELKDIMVRNIDNMAMRGERLELLVNKTDNLSANSVTFRKTSRNLSRALFWKNVKLYLISAAIIVFIIYIIISLACGGFGWGECVASSSPTPTTTVAPTTTTAKPPAP
ncbi:vesicle-associated membrane protein 7 [Neocloeon triangulifer]|uniref:vesicle-associated membrane protein 7 n=1 Tax=Neocloeon triangulifer TaxID=2078957 RepID=UPI00286EEFFA|nr:vesicle-associated membrane protein 7 [Neocloeon triangulifer]